MKKTKFYLYGPLSKLTGGLLLPLECAKLSTAFDTFGSVSIGTKSLILFD